MLTPRAQPSCVTRMKSAAEPWNQVAIITPSSCQTVRKRSQSPASRQTAQFSINSRRASRSMVTSFIFQVSFHARTRTKVPGYPRHVPTILSISGLSKIYASGFQALKGIDLEVQRGEIFALLGPNGAGKTTLISIVCGIVTASTGTVHVGGHDIVRDYRAARSMIGLVPQELTTDAFASVWAAVTLSRGMFGKAPNPAHIEKVLRELSLWDKKDSRINMLSGGMKRRLLIAKALSHEPQVLFLDEPTAGVDVSLRRDMWQLVRDLRATGVTVILTTHYIEEAEDMADRIGVINKGEIILVEDKVELMHKLGKKQLILQLQKKLDTLPAALAAHNLTLVNDGTELVFTYDTKAERTGVTSMLSALGDADIRFRDLQTTQSSLEDIFVGLVSER